MTMAVLLSMVRTTLRATEMMPSTIAHDTMVMKDDDDLNDSGDDGGIGGIGDGKDDE